MNKFIFVICGLLVMSISVFGQNILEKDLKRSFKNYDLVNLDKKVMLEKAKSEQTIEIRAYGREFEFILIPNDLRAGNYRAVETTDSGDRELERAEVITYKGKLRNDFDSEVRFTITEDNVEGLIYAGDGSKFFIAQAEKFSGYAGQNDALIYREGDLIKTVDLSDDIEGKMDFGFDILSGASFGEAQAEAELRQIEVAAEADYQWVTQAGGATAANNEILSILNLVDGIYKRDLNLTVKVTFQHAWSSADPYPTGSFSGLLDAFLGYWNANYSRSQYPRDTTHLFTGKFTNQGIAYIGVICRNPSSAYGVTARSGGVNHLITAHELAHNLGADHVVSSGACANSLMNPSVGPSATSFCDASKSTLTNFVTNYGSCLSIAGTTTTPTPTPTPTATPTPTPAATPTPTPSCTFSVTPSNLNFSAAGGIGSVSVATQSGCNWTAGSNQSFVSITSGSLGSGSGSVTYSVAPNTGASLRSAMLTIAGRLFTVQQNGAAITNNPNAARFDFDGDGRADISVFRPSNGTWYVLRSSNNSYYGVSFGQVGDLVTPADFDGDRKTDIVVFRPSNGTWYWLNSSTEQLAAAQFGQAGDMPLPGDFDGDGRADISVFRPSNGTWYRLNSSTGQFVAMRFGQAGDIPINGDFDGDGRADISVFRPGNGTWHILRSSDGLFYSVNFGQLDDIPAAADFDGDKRTDISVYRASTGTWYRLNSTNNSFFAQQFGIATDKPTAADFDGDGRADLAVFRPSLGSWYLQRSAAGFTGLQFGVTEDIPTPTILMP